MPLPLRVDRGDKYRSVIDDPFHESDAQAKWEGEQAKAVQAGCSADLGDG